MYEAFLRMGFPIMIAMALLSFACAWVLAAVKPPDDSGRKGVPDRLDPGWKYLDAGPEGVRKNVSEEVRTETKAV